MILYKIITYISIINRIKDFSPSVSEVVYEFTAEDFAGILSGESFTNKGPELVLAFEYNGQSEGDTFWSYLGIED